MDRCRFLQEYPGYNTSIEDLRKHQMPAFESSDATVYLDYAGSSPFTKTQVEAHSKSLLGSQWGNPHSHGPVCNAVLKKVQATRHRILSFLNVSPETHEVIFCSGATAAIRLIADCFPWNPTAVFAFSRLSHNSIIGIREVALAKGSCVICIDEDYHVLSVHGSRTARDDVSSYSLLAVPAECNFSGIRPRLSALNRIRRGIDSFSDAKQKWAILLDASKFCATAKLDLRQVDADFTVISFYKIFGLPTGLGALIVRKDAEHLLCKKIYYGGGTYDALIATERFYRYRQDLQSRLEDGSVPFTLIDSVNYGFDLIENELAGIDTIAKHCSALTVMVASEMAQMKHYTGAKVFEIYGNHFHKEMYQNQGPVIAFSVLNEAGMYRGYSEIHRLVSACGFQIRSGCFCNSGACERFLQLSPKDILKNFERGHVCGDDIDLIDGKATGCLRISFGYASTFSDAASWLTFAKRYLVKLEVGLGPLSSLSLTSTESFLISSICVFPVKSCTGFHSEKWPVSRSGGLLWDRQYALIDDRQRLLSQLKVPSLATITATICLETRILRIESRSLQDSYICSLDAERADCDMLIDVRDCSHVRQAIVYGDSRNWFTTAAGVNCCLIRFLPDDSFRGDVLVMSKSSLAALSEKCDVEWDLQSFRANIVLDGGIPFSEEHCKGFVSDQGLFFEAFRRCTRCPMIGKSQFSELSRFRSKPEFGVICRYLPLAADNGSLPKLLCCNTRICRVD